MGDHHGTQPSVPTTIYDPFKLIGLEVQDIVSLINNMADAGITSKFIKLEVYSESMRTFAIYKSYKFKDFCERKLQEALDELLK